MKRASRLRRYRLTDWSWQTISQPLTVARMTEVLQGGPLAKVLEIGTGSGYQTAVLGAAVWND